MSVLLAPGVLARLENSRNKRTASRMPAVNPKQTMKSRNQIDRGKLGGANRRSTKPENIDPTALAQNSVFISRIDAYRHQPRSKRNSRKTTTFAGTKTHN